MSFLGPGKLTRPGCELAVAGKAVGKRLKYQANNYDYNSWIPIPIPTKNSQLAALLPGQRPEAIKTRFRN